MREQRSVYEQIDDHVVRGWLWLACFSMGIVVFGAISWFVGAAMMIAGGLGYAYHYWAIGKVRR